MNNNHVFHLDCSCGCGGWRITKDEDYFYLDHYTMTFFSSSETAWQRLVNRIKFAWFALSGKSYSLSDIVIEKEDMQGFKDFINQVG